jgi:hypothetical protein
MMAAEEVRLRNERLREAAEREQALQVLLTTLLLSL